MAHKRHKLWVREQILMKPYDVPFTSIEIFETLDGWYANPPSIPRVSKYIAMMSKELNLEHPTKSDHVYQWVRRKKVLNTEQEHKV